MSAVKPTAEVYMVETIAGTEPRLISIGSVYLRDGGASLALAITKEVTLRPDTPLIIRRPDIGLV